MNKKVFVLLALISSQCLPVIYTENYQSERSRRIEEDRYRMERRFRGENEDGSQSSNVTFVKGILVWFGWRY